MRIYRSNPFDAVGRLPTAPRALLFAVLAALALAGFGVWAERKTSAERVSNVRQAVAAQGFGAATVERGKGGCRRASGLYRWTTATASGTACAGPRDRVEIRPSAG